ncbi:FecR domain-containing protein [uncultured Cyclobacterium sp.]|uniref:FecR family protein n=1 Tax=uncultured Cyclobacterium sp. TaxID=453820 RepID=UPI0030EEABCC
MKKSKPIFDDLRKETENPVKVSFANRSLSKTVLAQEKSKLLQRIATDEAGLETKSVAMENWKAIIFRYAAAAVILVVSLVAVISIDKVSHQTAYGEVASVQLPDGTKVTLNGNSLLEYSRFYWWFLEERKVSLNGEAFFDVVKQKTKDGDLKFQVFTEHLKVEVLGTEFNVIDRANQEVVVLEEGSVQVSILSTETTIPLIPGEYMSYDKMNFKVEHGSVVTEGYTSWKDNYIVLDNKTLGDLAQIINTVYGKKVVFKKNSDKEIILQGKVPSNEINVLIQALRLATNLRIHMEGDTVFVN